MADSFLSQFNFEVHLSESGHGGDEALVGSAAFSEVSGLDISLEIRAVREGGYNAGVRRLVGKTSSGNLVLKRGLTRDGGFWLWVQRCFENRYPLPYIGGSIEVYPAGVDRDSAQPARWVFDNGIATKVSMAGLDAKAGTAVPIEELHIAHEGLRREA